MYRAAADAQGRALPRLLAAGLALDGQVFLLATELLEGELLDTQRQRHLALRPLAVQALQHLHDTNLVHNDLREANLIITWQPSPRVWLIDLHLAFANASMAEKMAEMHDLDRLFKV